MSVKCKPVTLRPLQPGDEEYAVRWGQDQAFCLANDWDLNMPAERIRTHWQSIIADTSADFLRLGIEFNGFLIGFVDLAALDAESGEFGIAIGESRLWGQSLGRQAGELLLQHAFDDLHLKFVWAEVHEPNLRSHALMRTLGFTETSRHGTDEYQGQTVPLVQYRIYPDQ